MNERRIEKKHFPHFNLIILGYAIEYITNSLHICNNTVKPYCFDSNINEHGEDGGELNRFNFYDKDNKDNKNNPQTTKNSSQNSSKTPGNLIGHLNAIEFDTLLTLLTNILYAFPLLPRSTSPFLDPVSKTNPNNSSSSNSFPYDSSTPK